MQPEDFVFFSVEGETWRLCNINLLFEIAIQERRLDVEVMDTLVLVGGDGEQEPH